MKLAKKHLGNWYYPKSFQDIQLAIEILQYVIMHVKDPNNIECKEFTYI